MKEYVKLIIYVLVLILLIFASVKSYESLTKKYTTQDISAETEKNKTQENTNIEKNVEKATDFTVIDTNGKKISLSDYLGKPVVVNFWATWCGPCKMELPAFDKLCKEYDGQVSFMMVNLTDGYQETVDGVKQFVSENEYVFPVFFDTEYSASDSYQIYSIPETIFVDKEGKLVKSQIGAMSEDILRKYIEELIGE